MSGKLLAVLVLAVIAVGLGYLIYTNNVETAIKTISAFDKFTVLKNNVEITHFVPKQEENIETTSFVNQTVDNSTQLNQVTVIDDIPVFSVTNIPPIFGYIKIYDSDNNPIKPYTYDYRISISCAKVDGFSYCIMNNITNRGETVNGGLDENKNELGGKYYYDMARWIPQNTILPANLDSVLLDVSILVDETDNYGIIHSEKTTYQMRIVR